MNERGVRFVPPVGEDRYIGIGRVPTVSNNLDWRDVTPGLTVRDVIRDNIDYISDDLMILYGKFYELVCAKKTNKDLKTSPYWGYVQPHSFTGYGMQLREVERNQIDLIGFSGELESSSIRVVEPTSISKIEIPSRRVSPYRTKMITYRRFIKDVLTCSIETKFVSDDGGRRFTTENLVSFCSFRNGRNNINLFVTKSEPSESMKLLLNNVPQREVDHIDKV